MVTVRRGNVTLKIADDKDLIRKYLSKGYNVINPDGSIVQRSTARNVDTLEILLKEAEAKIEKLEHELAEAKAAKEEPVKKPAKRTKVASE